MAESPLSHKSSDADFYRWLNDPAGEKAKLEAERDRYREALRAIRDEQTDEGDLNWQTANAALTAWGN